MFFGKSFVIWKLIYTFAENCINYERIQDKGCIA